MNNQNQVFQFTLQDLLSLEEKVRNKYKFDDLTSSNQLHHIVIGPSGCGKSTYLSLLKQHNLTIKRGMGDNYEIQHSDQVLRIGDGTQSTTSQFTYIQAQQGYFWDTPGLGDSKGNIFDLHFQSELVHILNSLRNVRIVIMISSTYLQNRKTDFLQNFSQFVQLATDPYIENSICLVISKCERDHVNFYYNFIEQILRAEQNQSQVYWRVLNHLYQHRQDKIAFFFNPEWRHSQYILQDNVTQIINRLNHIVQPHSFRLIVQSDIKAALNLYLKQIEKEIIAYDEQIYNLAESSIKKCTSQKITKIVNKTTLTEFLDVVGESPEMNNFLRSKKETLKSYQFLLSQFPEIKQDFISAKQQKFEQTLLKLSKPPVFKAEFNNSITIDGYFLDTAQIMRKLSNSGQLTNLTIFCEKLFINSNLILPGANLHIIAHEIAAEGNFMIDLSGNKGHQLPKASNGVGFKANNRDGADGKDGRDGQNGRNGGSLTLDCVKIIQNPSDIHLNLSGGDGSNGQDGGDGAQGLSTEDASLEDIRIKSDQAKIDLDLFEDLWHLEKQKIDFEQNWKCLTLNYQSFQAYQTDPKKAGKGGDGGCGGKPGKGGLPGGFIPINCVNDDIKEINVYVLQGRDGQEGKHGSPGEGGEQGRKAQGLFCKEQLGFSEFDDDKKIVISILGLATLGIIHIAGMLSLDEGWVVFPRHVGAVRKRVESGLIRKHGI